MFLWNASRTKLVLALAIVAVAVVTVAPASARSQNCPACGLIGVRQEVSPQGMSAIGKALSAYSNGQTVGGPAASTASAVKYSDYAPLLPEGGTLWQPGQPLPYAFKRPWEWPESNFNPGFMTPYYGDRGPINHPSAPWNFMVPQMAGLSTFDHGMTSLGLPLI